MVGLGALLVSLACGCAGAPAPAVPAPAAPAPWSTPCAAVPDAPPAGATVRLALHDYERPEAQRRLWLHDGGAACPDDDLPLPLRGTFAARACLPLPAAELAALWSALGPLRAVRLRALPLRPHHGGRSLDLRWPGGACAVDLADYTEVHPDDEALVVAALDAVQAAGAAAR